MFKPETTTIYFLHCDRCNVRYDGSICLREIDTSVFDEAQGWHEWERSDDDKHLCPDCWTWSEDDERIVSKPITNNDDVQT